MSYTPCRVAFVDETIRNDIQLGRFYIMTAAILDKAHPEYGAFWRELRNVAWSQPNHTIHASTLIRSPNGQKYLDAAERAIGESPAVRSITVLRAKIPSKGEEIARQRCIASLATSLASFDVQSVTLDTRDPLGQAHKSITSPRLGPRNALDASTILDLQASGELPTGFDVRHGNDEKIHELWVADVVAYAIGRALADHNPTRLHLLAPHIQVREAQVLPVAERGPEGAKHIPASSLNAFLGIFLAEAKQIWEEEQANRSS